MITMTDTPLIGDSRAMQKVRQRIAIAARTSLSVLVQGPTGVGKELVAMALHRAFHRPGPFVAFNVCALSESMFEDSLFGHVRGAFTGALHATRGYLGEANEGTLFLDEVGGLPLGLQVKLLRALETGFYRPIGSSADAHSAFRLVTAINEPLEDVMAAAKFRADLAFRMAGLVIAIPSLADRVGDIPLLVRYFLTEGGHAPTTVAAEAMRWLQARDWPGNVRQLRQFVQLLVAISPDTVTASLCEEVAAQYCLDSVRPLRSSEESTLIREALSEAGGCIDQAARELGIHRATLYRRMKRLGIAEHTSPLS